MNNKTEQMIWDKKDEIIQMFAEADKEASLNLGRKITVCLDTETGELNLFYGDVVFSGNEYPLHTFLHSEEVYAYISPSDCLCVLKDFTEEEKLNKFSEAFRENYIEENGELDGLIKILDCDCELWNAITENPDFEEEVKAVCKFIIEDVPYSIYEELFYSVIQNI